MSMADSASTASEVDVVVVGAGLSGIGAGYRLQQAHPERSYAILEARDAIGGTWDLFRYPGVRSDSDMYTLGYPFKPWTSPQMIGSGDDIREYVAETAREFGIDRHIRFGSKATDAAWSSETQRWTLTVTHGGERREIRCAFLYLCAGYYRYDQPYDAQLPGLDRFAGTVVHPQFWPEGLEYAGKKVVVVGSGATAVTLVPALADSGAAHVSMLQRTPTYMTVLPTEDPLARKLDGSRIPPKIVDKINRAKSIAGNSLIYQLSRRRPETVRKMLRGILEKAVDDPAVLDRHFTPTYQPWDQRLCLVPDGDLFRAMNDGRVDVVTDHIETFLPEGVRLRSGDVLEADIVVTATGLALEVAGGIALSVDGEQVDPAQRWQYRGLMLSGVPNAAVCFGYINASWTLRADLSSRYVCRLLSYLDEHGYGVAMPIAPGDLDARPMLDLRSGYVTRSAHLLPRAGAAAPWRVRQNYALDALHMRRADLAESMQFTAKKRPAAVTTG
ncbi:flavin-containing monooxygenase [Cumulibacter manganitolerans]|uniref:flavin-containing monooxygenase n=1 Tax=Cumulibacter manganitolerans TaxID=1884992 RepID=UPI001E54787C|nr:NAD(P)/FAD-dependent oxidoreductase [Cumulibacter manganitolerans]